MNSVREEWTYGGFAPSFYGVMKFSMCINVTLLLALLLTSVHAEDSAITKISHPTSEWIQRADLYFRKTSPEPQGWLLLCPGRNGNGEELLKDLGWSQFAKEKHLLMCGVSFASSKKEDLPGRYTEVQKGSGDLILKSMDHYAGRELPMLVVGFSAGARFATNWVTWKPERVIAWSAQAVGHWPEPLPSDRWQPPGIVACGEHDASAWFASLQYFQAVRKEGHQAIWLSLSKLAHQRSLVLDDFTRQLFAWGFTKQPNVESWFDIVSKKRLTVEQMREAPAFSCWLPEEKLQKAWILLHNP